MISRMKRKKEKHWVMMTFAKGFEGPKFANWA